MIILLFSLFVACSPKISPSLEMPFEEEIGSREIEADEVDRGDYYQNDFIRYDDYVYSPTIKTPHLYKKGFELASPFLQLGSGEQVVLEFDDLGNEAKDYYYTLIHCNANWEPSDLVDTEYLEGFFEDRLNDYRFSFNTIEPFTHYTLELPNDQISITQSGNYVLLIYQDNDKEKPVLTRRFVVFENKVEIAPLVKRPSHVLYRDLKHEIDFNINHPAFTIQNPINELKIVMLQNQRWDNALSGFTPTFIREGQLVYDFDDKNLFTAGNEYRHIDLKSLRYQTDRMLNIKSDTSGYHVYILPDEKRTYREYYSKDDINGKYLIKSHDVNNSALAAEYVTLHFNLPFPQALIDANIYVFGELTDWQFKKEFQLKYNKEKKAYETAALVKQGYYNYEYIYVRDDAKGGDVTFIEGTHFETLNDYTIIVYYRDITLNFDRPIGVKFFNSSNVR